MSPISTNSGASEDGSVKIKNWADTWPAGEAPLETCHLTVAKESFYESGASFTRGARAFFFIKACKESFYESGASFTRGWAVGNAEAFNVEAPLTTYEEIESARLLSLHPVDLSSTAARTPVLHEYYRDGGSLLCHIPISKTLK
ncbi:unnamed protein product [Linum trigynum]|uniref:Uncharacterized protein n=1 Tax=Linum trigynum TaxID=586398 RepID=A0AAV2FZJ4_9ROSI